MPDPTPEIARRVFGDRTDLAVSYAEILVTDGVTRGLIGPREAPRIWDRHLLNCAVVAELIPAGELVIDVGSGAGLPGVVLAIARPDLTIVLLEPLARRAAFLDEVVGRLGLDRTSVVRARAEECAPASPRPRRGAPGSTRRASGPARPRPGARSTRAVESAGGPATIASVSTVGAGRVSVAGVVTARAVAPLDRLAAWCLPLVAPGGRMLALKGSSAAEELTEHAAAIASAGGSSPRIRLCGADLVSPPTTVVEILKIPIGTSR